MREKTETGNLGFIKLVRNSSEWRLTRRLAVEEMKMIAFYDITAETGKSDTLL